MRIANIYRQLAVVAGCALGTTLLGWHSLLVGQAADAPAGKAAEKSDDAPKAKKKRPIPGVAPKDDRPNAAGQEGGTFSEAETCKNCHSQTPPGALTDFVRVYNQYPLWKEKDKHSQAWAVLQGERSQQMARLLGYDVAKDDRCLRCHSMKDDPGVGVARGVHADLTDGVSCDGCHGPAKNWLLVHTQRANWFEMSAEEKEKLGFRDVRDPVKRSTMCFSCHIGSTKDGRVVTHDMYAAGHPPLPSIEVTFFSENEPRHWTLLSEKSKDIQEFFEHPPTQTDRIRMTVIGGVMALRQSMQLLASEAAGEQPRMGREWPDLAAFDCYACHHDLKLPSWRQERGYRASAGRPVMHVWPAVLVDLALRHLGEKSATLDGLLSNVDQAMARDPFGNPREVAEAARKVVQWADERLAKLQSLTYDAAAGKKMLEELAEAGATETHDFPSARQLAWALQMFYDDLKGSLDAENGKKVASVLDSLNRQLHLELPSGKDRQIMKELPQTLESIESYDPEAFQKTMKSLYDTLKS